jgi:nitroreductase
MQTTYKDISDAVIRSQHCQRNFDLSKKIPQDDLDLIIHSVTNCPSKQNIAYYKVHAITDQKTIEKIHLLTDGFTKNYETGETTTNSQVLANLLLVFEMEDFTVNSLGSQRNLQTVRLTDSDLTPEDWNAFKKDSHMSTGVAAGYANLTASIIGYNTGCCACFDNEAIKEELGLKNDVMLLMGIGFKNEEVNRRVHPQTGFKFPTLKKQKIDVNYI